MSLRSLRQYGLTDAVGLIRDWNSQSTKAGQLAGGNPDHACRLGGRIMPMLTPKLVKPSAPRYYSLDYDVVYTHTHSMQPHLMLYRLCVSHGDPNVGPNFINWGPNIQIDVYIYIYMYICIYMYIYVYIYIYV